MSFDCEAWRAAYPDASYADQQRMHSEMYSVAPLQRHFDEAITSATVERFRPARVVELGGWDGELAKLMLDRFQFISSWVNVELCAEARRAGGRTGRRRRYSAPEVGDWYWTRKWKCDLFVASHTIEHLSAEHLALVLGATDAQVLLLDAPLQDLPTRWDGYSAMHVLEVGWPGVTAICAAAGYALLGSMNHDTGPTSGGPARACTYVRA